MRVQAMKRTVNLTDYECRLVTFALKYWNDRLDNIKCDSTPHKMAGMYVYAEVNRLLPKFEEPKVKP
jgi:hypothetical protein